MKYKLMIFDIDGVFTDGGIYYGPNDEVWRKFNTQDGLGICLLKFAGITPIIITGKKSSSVSKRARELRIDHVYQGIKNKQKKLMHIVQKFEVDLSEIIYMGDDWNDFPALEMVGFPICVNSAPEEIKKICKFIPTNESGKGAVREAIEYILKKQGLYQEAVEKFLYNLKRLEE
jgi:3-deoxy-D-manno-octulosonate 8-phosphate phosphatase (KDO 8-P phosphatase)